MGAFDEKTTTAAENMGKRRFSAETDFLPLQVTVQIALSNGVQPADGVSH